MATPLKPKIPLDNPLTAGALVAPSPPRAETVAVTPADVQPVLVNHTLEACAAAVVAKLPSHVADRLREIAYVYNRQPLWAILAGHALKAYENGHLQAPVLDPSWLKEFTSMPVDPGQAEYRCENCSTVFQPKRYKQRACSNACGTELAKMDVALWEANGKR